MEMHNDDTKGKIHVENVKDMSSLQKRTQAHLTRFVKMITDRAYYVMFF